MNRDGKITNLPMKSGQIDAKASRLRDNFAFVTAWRIALQLPILSAGIGARHPTKADAEFCFPA
jgi:hypothetical protein